MKATKKLLCMALAMTTIGTSAVHAQRVTYNHDTSKKNQVTVMELGSGSLTPELYYTLLHRNYKKSAAQKNKQSFRTTASIALYNQVDEAEAIDSALTARAKIEALHGWPKVPKSTVRWMTSRRTLIESFQLEATFMRSNAGRSTTTCFNAPSSPPKRHICPMLKERECI